MELSEDTLCEMVYWDHPGFGRCIQRSREPLVREEANPNPLRVGTVLYNGGAIGIVISAPGFPPSWMISMRCPNCDHALEHHLTGDPNAAICHHCEWLGHKDPPEVK